MGFSPVRKSRITGSSVALAASWSVILLTAVIGLTSAFDDRSTMGFRSAVGAAIIIGAAVTFGVLQQFHAFDAISRRLRVAGWIAVALAFVNFPLADNWEAATFAVAITAVLVRGRWAPAAILAVYALSVLATISSSDGNGLAAFGVSFIVLGTSIVLIAFTELARSQVALRASGEQIARLQVDAERYRISRDLHDVIGRTLVTALLRNQAAIQLFAVDPARAREQLDRVHEVLSEGQADLRRLTTGPILADLVSEIATVESVCARLNITCEADVVALADDEVDRVFAALVRESSTNMLKHAYPRTCVVRVANDGDGTVLEFTNDGLTRKSADTTTASGTGLRDLAERVEGLGGTFTATRSDEGMFAVRARVPLREVAR